MVSQFPSVLRIWSALTLAGAACLVASDLRAQPPEQAAAEDAAVVQPFVSESTFLIVKVDIAKLALPDLETVLANMPPESKTITTKAYEQLQERLKEVRSALNGQPIYLSVAIPMSRQAGGTLGFVRKSDQLNVEQVKTFAKQTLRRELLDHAGYLVQIEPPDPGTDVAHALEATPAVPRDEVAAAFQTVARFPIQVLLLPPEHVRRTFQELPTELPAQIGGGPSSLLTEGVLWATLGIDPAKLQAHVTIQSATNDAAQKLAAHLPKMVSAMVESASKSARKQLPPEVLTAVSRTATPEVAGNQILLRLDGRDEANAGMKLLTVLGRSFEDASRRRTNTNRFKQILLAFHNYHDVFRSFPPIDKYRDKSGKQLLSWRVHILPFVEQSKLYEQFRLNEPWNSPHNLKLLDKMPDVFRSHEFEIAPDRAIKPGYTTFQTVVGEDAAFGQDKAVRIRDFRDGTSNTVVLVEVKPELAVPWTAPDDYVFDPKNPSRGLAVRADGTWLCALADGSVHYLPGDLPPKTFLILFQKSDGTPVPQGVFGR